MSAELELRRDPNPNLVTFEKYDHRWLRLPVRLNFEVQTKLAMFRRLAQKLPPLPGGASVLDLGCGRGGNALRVSPPVPGGYGLLARLELSREGER